jgi:dolichol-phosphate mannosyltransferase
MVELSIVIPAWNEGENVKVLLERLRPVAAKIDRDHEIAIVVPSEADTTCAPARAAGARIIVQTEPGYGGALRAGFAETRGRSVLTMDADCSHDPHFLLPMWAARDRAQVVIASRYVQHGHAEVELSRAILSWILNGFFRTLLALPLRDISSGFRLYDRRVLDEVRSTGRDFDVLEELVIRAYLAGFAVEEVPFHYRPRLTGRSHAKLIKFGIAFLKTAWRMWKLRHSRVAADYEARAFHSRNPLRRWWHRRRYRAVMSLVGQAPARVLDLGCGSSMLVMGIPQAVGVDHEPTKLRYIRRLGVRGARASLASLPFASGSFDLVIAAHVLEKEPDDPAIVREIARVLAPGGAAIVATPDFGSLRWRLAFALRSLLAPGSAALDFPTRLTRAALEERLKAGGLEVEKAIGGAEVVVRAVKRA